MLEGFLRTDGRKGIRIVAVVACVVECARHVARQIAAGFQDDDAVHLIGLPGCYPDVDAGRILEGRASLPDVGREIHELVQRVGEGKRTKSEAPGHREFIVTYKSFGPLRPACLPV